MPRTSIIALIALAPALASARPIAAFGGGGGAYARMRSGFFLGGDTGLALSTGTDALAPAAREQAGAGSWWTLGVRAGHEWANGIAVQLRFDDLGSRAGDGSNPIDVASAGLRYSLPFIVMPFVDALIGPAFENGQTSFAAGLGVGGSLLITRHLALDLAFRDWMTDLGSVGIRHIPTVTVGVALGFGR